METLQQRPVRICLLALIGLPASGKTTFSQRLLMLKQNHFNVIHICYDDHLQLSRQQSESEFEFRKQRSEILSTITQIVESLKNTAMIPSHLHAILKLSMNTNCQKVLIICDDNNYYRSMRYKLYQLCRENECTYAQIYFNCSLELAVQRNATRATVKRVPRDTIQRMAAQLETPNITKCSWELGTLFLDECYENGVIDNTTLAYLCKAFESTLKSRPVQTKVANVQSLVHQLDLLLRRRINCLLQKEESTLAQRKEKAAKLVAKRKEIIQGFRAKGDESSLRFDNFNEYVNLLH